MIVYVCYACNGCIYLPLTLNGYICAINKILFYSILFLWQLSPIVVFSSAKSLALEDVMLPRCVIILKYFLNEIVHF